MIKITFLLIIFQCSFLFANAQPQTEWVKRYSDINNHDVNFVDMALDKQGNVFISGYITVGTFNKDILTLKYDNNGNLKWVRTYDSPVHQSDVPNRIAVDNSGNIIVAGYSFKTNGCEDYFVIKYASNGDSLWSSRLSYQSDTLAHANAVAVDDSDNVYVVGFFNIMWNYAGIFVKYNKYGSIQWIKYYILNGTFGNDAIDIIISKNRFIYCILGMIGVGAVPTKYDMNGNLIWQSVDSINGNKILLDNNDNIIVGGDKDLGSSIGRGLIMIKHDSSGNKLWSRTYHNNIGFYSNDEASGVAIDNFGNSFITGTSPHTGQAGPDYVTIKYYTNGDSAWVRRYNPATASIDNAYSVAADKYGNAYVTGASNHYNMAYGYTTIKYTPSGVQSWVERYDGGAPYGGMSEGKKILIDSNLNIYVSGNSNITGTNEIATIKYSQPTGIRNISQQIPDKYALYQNYPNPFNPTTKIKFDIANRFPIGTLGNDRVVVKIYDITGREIQTLVNEQLKPGSYEVTFDGNNLSSGIYFYRLVAGNYLNVKRMLLIK